LMALGGGCASGSVLPPGLPAGLELSAETRDALSDAFDDWQVAAIDPQSAACLTGEAAALPLVRGDFNSDGRPDVALAIKTADGVHLVVVLDRLEESTVIDVDDLGPETANGFLGVEAQGRAYVDIRGRGDYFSADTLAVNRCGQPRTVYLWSGVGFLRQVLDSVGGGTAPAASPNPPQHPL